MTTTRKTTPKATQDQEAAALAAAEANTQAQAAEAEAQAALAQAQDEVLATVHPINGQQDPQEAEVNSNLDSALASPTRATWRQHGNPLSGWSFFGTSRQGPKPQGHQGGQGGGHPPGCHSQDLCWQDH